MSKKAGCKTVRWINPKTWESESEKCKKIVLKNKHFSNTTDLSFYDGIIKYPEYHKQAKGMCGRIVHMSPDKYFEGSAKIQKTSALRQREMVYDQLVKKYIKRSNAGGKMPLTVLDFEGNNQEGRHRAMVAEKLGLKKMPVLIVEKCK